MNSALVSTPAAPGDPVYGVLHIGAMQVALALTALREVIPCPPQLSALPATSCGLLGAVEVRGRVVPVLDLRPQLGLPVGDAASHAGQVVALLRQSGRLLGLLVDGVRGLTQPARAAISEVVAEGGGLLFSGSFTRPEDPGVVSVLDAEALLRLPGIPVLRDDAPAPTEQPEQRAAPRRPMMLVRCGQIGLALDVADIHTTLPRVTLAASSLDGQLCRGVVEHAGRRLPAVDLLALMGLGELPPAEPREALLLHFDSGWVALLVSRVIDITAVAASELLPLAPLAVRRPALFQGALDVPGRGVHLVVGANVLRHEPALLALATLNTSAANAKTGNGDSSDKNDEAGRGAPTRDNPVITYDIGAVVATRLAQISEVLALPTHSVQGASGHPAVTGMFIHRGHSVTLVCLASLLGAPARPTAADARVLLVVHGDTHVGFVVPRLCHIESTVWERPQRAVGRTVADGPAATGLREAGLRAVVELGMSTGMGSGEQRRTLHLIDLRALAASLQRGDAPAPAAAVADASFAAI